MEGVRVGDLVFGLGGVSDTTAEFAVLTAWSAVPSGWSVTQAASAGLASATAAAAWEPIGDLAGRTVLIEGASGAVGSAAAVWAVAAGARVIGTGSASSHERLSALGIHPLTYGPGLAERVAPLAPEGVDAALHLAPSASLPDLVGIVGDPTRVVTVVDTAGAARLGTRTVDARNDSALLRGFAELGTRGVYLPHVDAVVPIEEIARAHELAENGGGKIVVSVASD